MISSLIRRITIKGRNSLKRTIYRQRVRLGLVPQRSLLPQEAFQQLRSVCIFLGPYRNLTTLTAALLSLHPKCQVLNHSGFRVLEEPQLNFFTDSSPSCFRRFLQYLVHESQGGTGGDDGGSITLSHAFRSELMRETYRNRFGDELEKKDAQCFVWKESLTVTNYLRAHEIDLDQLFETNPHVRFLLPIRHPIDCAISNAKTGHFKRFEQIDDKGTAGVLQAVVREIAWFRQQSINYPGRFFFFCQYEMDESCLQEFAAFLNIEADERWIADVIRCYELKESYEHSDELLTTFRNAIEQSFPDDEAFRDTMLGFIS